MTRPMVGTRLEIARSSASAVFESTGAIGFDAASGIPRPASSSPSGSYDTSGLGTIAYDLGNGTFGNVTAFEDQAVEVIWGAGDSSQAFTITGNHFENVGSVVLNNLDPSQVIFSRAGTNEDDLLITNTATDATLTISDEFASSSQGSS